MFNNKLCDLQLYFLCVVEWERIRWDAKIQNTCLKVSSVELQKGRKGKGIF